MKITPVIRAAALAGTVLLGLLAIVGSWDDNTSVDCGSTLTVAASATSVAERGSITLTASAPGSVNGPEWTLTWYARPPTGGAAVAATTRSGITGFGAIDTLTIDPVVYGEQQGWSYWVKGSYYCSTSDSDASSVSNEVTLSVAPGPSEWITEPTSVTVAPGNLAVFHARAYGDNAYQWQQSSDGFATANDISGATTTGYTVLSPAVGDSGTQFRLKATNRGTGEAMLSRSATMTVVDPATVYSFSASWVGSPPALVSGAGITVPLRAAQTNGTEGLVELRLLGAPAGLGISPAVIRLPANGGGDYTITFTADPSVAPGTYPIGVDLVKDGTLLQHAPLTLVVTVAGGIGINLEAGTVLMVPNRSATAGVLVTPLVGTTANVTVDYVTDAPEIIVGRPGHVAFAGNGDGRPVPVPYPLTTAGTFPAYGLHTNFVASENGSTASTTLTIEFRPFATLDVSAGSNRQSVPTLVSALLGAGYSVGGDLVHGQLRMLVSPTSATRPVLTAAIGSASPLQLVNLGSAPLSLPAGAFRMEIDGSYTIPAGTSMSLLGELALQYGPASGPARPLGRVEQTVNNSLVDPVATTGDGMTVDILRGDRTGLRVNVNSPALTLGAGETLTLTAKLSVTDAAPSARVDFSSVPVRLCMNLPAGVTLEHNALAGITWCN